MLFVGPNDGEMACGEFGPGRMAEPLEIVAAIEAALAGPAAGRWPGKALVTAGPTARAGRSGALPGQSFQRQAGLCHRRGPGARAREATLVSGPVSVPTPPGVKRVDVDTAREMLAACEAALPADVR